MYYSADTPFWELGDFKDASLSKIDLPDDVTKKINAWWKDPKRFLVFCGNPGVGKTYLIAAMIHSIKENKNYTPLNHFRYFHEKDLFSDLRNFIAKGWDYERRIKDISEAFLIFLDDIRSGQSTEWQKESLFNFIDQRTISGYPTVITSNLFLQDMEKEFEKRFISRLKDKRNTIIELDWIDKRT